MVNNVDWEKVLTDIAVNISVELDLNIIVEHYILQEVKDRISSSLAVMNIERPNVAKVAGVVAFWVRKLKPFCYAPDKMAHGNKLSPLNELIGVQAGLAICRLYKDDFICEEFHLPKRLLTDWLHSLRFHSHSPHSALFSFELLTSEKDEICDTNTVNVLF